jgi:hypothetical protein
MNEFDIRHHVKDPSPGLSDIPRRKEKLGIKKGRTETNTGNDISLFIKEWQS